MNDAVIADLQSAVAITGAATTLARLQEEPNWAVAIATGCWHASAQFKLSQASIPFAHLPLAHSDQLLAREDILSDALAQAETHYQTVFERVVYIGDGLWDVRATRNLQMPFVGIAQNDDRAAKLKAEGASKILPDFSDYQSLLDALLAAQIPK